jgi:hypothetical protein
MTDTPKHSKITKYEVVDETTIKATTESYYDELVGRKEDVISKVKTDRNSFLSDVISCLDVISKQQAKELHLTITVDDWNQPSLIIKQYTVRKENFNRR